MPRTQEAAQHSQLTTAITLKHCAAVKPRTPHACYTLRTLQHTGTGTGTRHRLAAHLLSLSASSLSPAPAHLSRQRFKSPAGITDFLEVDKAPLVCPPLFVCSRLQLIVVYCSVATGGRAGGRRQKQQQQRLRE
jgi:hypothetical protein